MAWTTLTAQQRAAGQPIDANMIDALYNNPTAIANGDPGAPNIQTAALEQGGGIEAVTTPTIRAEAVTTATIRDGNVTAVKMASLAVSYELLEAQTPSAASTIDFTTGFASDYKEYYLVYTLENGTDNWDLRCRLYANATWITAASYSGDGSSNATYFNVGDAIGGNGLTGSSNYNAISGTVKCTNPQAVDSIRFVQFRAAYPPNGTLSYPALLTQKDYTGGLMSGSGMDYVLDGIRLYPSAGTVTGTVYLYGINA